MSDSNPNPIPNSSVVCLTDEPTQYHISFYLITYSYISTRVITTAVKREIQSQVYGPVSIATAYDIRLKHVIILC